MSGVEEDKLVGIAAGEGLHYFPVLTGYRVLLENLVIGADDVLEEL